MKYYTEIMTYDFIIWNPRGPFDKLDLTSILAWKKYSIHYQMWNEIVHPFPNFNGGVAIFWEWIWSFHLTLYWYIKSYLCCQSVFVKEAPGRDFVRIFPDSQVHGANMWSKWVLSAPGGPHVCPMTLAIRVVGRNAGISCLITKTI